jgi:hypothetical protein
MVLNIYCFKIWFLIEIHKDIHELLVVEIGLIVEVLAVVGLEIVVELDGVARLAS